MEYVGFSTNRHDVEGKYLFRYVKAIENQACPAARVRSGSEAL